jgi:hypothetical protein
MLKFNKSSFAGLLVVALVAGAAYVTLQLPARASERLSAAEILHARTCTLCLIPYYSHDGSSSRLGIDPALKDSPAPASLTAR